jgi:uncharacterized protein (DUF1684 family)
LPAAVRNRQDQDVNGAATLELLDWKRRIFALYAAVRAEADPFAGWRLWRSTRDELFRTHPQSPLEPEARAGVTGLHYFEYDPALRLAARLEDAPPAEDELPVSRDAPIRFRRLGTLDVELPGGARRLEAYWLDAYGGGLFLPFRDAMSGDETYGGGRYLLDTVKGADLGERDGELILDFNFAYHPSCVYSGRWACPLSPPANTLDVPIRAGERLSPSASTDQAA